VRWKRGLTREEVEERLGTTGGFRLPLGQSRYSGVWIVLVLVFVALALVGGLPGGGEGRVDLKRVFEPFPATPSPSGPPPAGAKLIGRDVQQTWKELFRRAGVDYRPAKLVVVDRVTRSACGLGVPAATEAFYCGLDTELLLNSGLGDAYRIAHGYAHHVQEILGITEQIARGAEESPRQARDLWRRHELQADCLAGVWAHSALRNADAPAAIQLATIPVDPDHAADLKNWTGAPREERARWFRRGFGGGLPAACDSFSV
jgi:uncharacterized protein